ncbi:unnamed protein product [Ceratitis capitata]|uniref:(Mediterranean fruit fly) hypothetical protein n=1 Tax=Ceratitis capitata TaxID=7213 RepID=A0A811UM48_CERCA|nr:unnamed protein product [Ceratitis capitata]
MEVPITTPMRNFQMPYMCNSNFLNAPNFEVPAYMSNFQSTTTYDMPAVPNWESYVPNLAGTEVLSTPYSASDAYKPNTSAERVLVPCKTSLVATVRPTKSFETRHRKNADGEINPTHWQTIKTKIMPILHEVLRSKGKSNKHRIIDLRNAHEDRIQLFGLGGHRTLKLFQNTLQLMSQLWPDSNITVMPKRLLSRRPRYRAFISTEPSDPETIMTIIKVSNPALPTNIVRYALREYLPTSA